jgi:hypothetical protein
MAKKPLTIDIISASLPAAELHRFSLEVIVDGKPHFRISP